MAGSFMFCFWVQAPAEGLDNRLLALELTANTSRIAYIPCKSCVRNTEYSTCPILVPNVPGQDPQSARLLHVRVGSQRARTDLKHSSALLPTPAAPRNQATTTLSPGAGGSNWQTRAVPPCGSV